MSPIEELAKQEYERGVSDGRYAVVQAVLEILKGIDQDEMDGGWWETSTGVAFGEGKVEAIRALL